MMEKITKVIEEGDNVHSYFHKHANECHHIFHLVNDWVGFLECHNKPVEDLEAQIKQMNQEAQAIKYLEEKNVNFV
jgi:hypothetical protein